MWYFRFLKNKTSLSDPHFFADPDRGKNLHVDPDRAKTCGSGNGSETLNKTFRITIQVIHLDLVYIK